MKNERIPVEIDKVERCRQVRRDLEKEYGGLDGLFAHFAELDQRRLKRQAKRGAAGKRARTAKKVG